MTMALTPTQEKNARLGRDLFKDRHVQIRKEARHVGILVLSTLLFVPACFVPVILRLKGVIKLKNTAGGMPPLVIDLAFGCLVVFAIWMTGLTIRAYFASRKHQKLASRHSGAAWLRDHPWTGSTLLDDSRSALGAGLMVALFLPLFLVPFVYAAIYNPGETPALGLWLLRIFLVPFCLLAVAFLIGMPIALYQAWRNGRAKLQLHTLPIQVGGSASGILTLRSKHYRSGPLVAVLRCVSGEVVHRSTDSDGNVDYKFGYETWWERRLELNPSRRGLWSTKLPISINLPPNLPPSRVVNALSDDHILWELEIRRPGSDGISKQPRFFIHLPVY